MEKSTPTVLIVVAEGCEDMEVIVPLSVLKIAEANVVLAKVPEDEFDAKSTECMLGRGMRVICDCFIDEIAKSDYDMVIAPGGRPGMDTLAKSAMVVELLKRHRESEKWICSSSAGSAIILGTNGLIHNIPVTTYPGFDYLLANKEAIKKHVVVANKTSKLKE